MLQVPLTGVPSQTLSVTLGGQAAQIDIYQLGYPPSANLYFDLMNDGVSIVTARLALNGVFLIGDAQYLGFSGDFMFIDTQGTQDPLYSGLGTRWQLIYVTPFDIDLQAVFAAET